MRIAVTDYVEPPFDIEAGVLPAGAELVALNAHDEAAMLAAPLESFDALLVWHAPVTANVARRLTRCRIVVRYGVGFDAIDTAALGAQGIPFCNTPDYGTEEVADTACAMILALQRKIVSYDRMSRRIKEGWQEHVLPPLQRTNAATLGVVGVGRIGTAVMNRMRPFGWQLIGFDPYQPSGHEKAIGYRRVRRLHDLLVASDVVTIHCPLNGETRGMVDESFLRAMKQGAMLVNTARGGILAGLDALHRVLKSGHLAAAALDVLPEEPPSPHALLDAWRSDAEWLCGRFLINPHSAYYSTQAWHEMRAKTAETVTFFVRDGMLRNRIA
ncbi:MAG: C-terminal binding protein [Pseudorhodoplanes sp.]|nr:C-terminal binding protein [Pseudorhodoplanes sp.]GIK79320.1 MAG: dehydrogenase [Alphaproteobacteria bacterium]